MKSNFLVNWMGTSILALSMAILPLTLSASAQTTTQNDPTTPATTTTTAENDGFDWGLLGLLGLIGLAGLKKSDRDTSSSYSDRTATPSTSSNPRY